MYVQVLTIPEAAEKLGISKEQLWHMISSGVIQTLTKDNRLYVCIPDDDKKPKRKKKKKVTESEKTDQYTETRNSIQEDRS
jgi:RNA-splicing ligase RtcB